MAVEEPPEGGPAIARNDAAPGRGSVPPGEPGARRDDTVRRIRRETETKLARVRATARLVEEDRIGLAGYIPFSPSSP